MSGDTASEVSLIYRKWFRGIFGYCAYRLYSRSLAEDATSAVFLRFVEKYPALRGEGELKVRNWLYGTASNVVASYLKDAKRRKEIAAALLRDKENGLARDYDKGDRLDWPVLYEAMAELKPEVRNIVALRYFQGLQTSAIAELLGMKHVTVRVHISRAIKTLRKKLEKPLGPKRKT